MSKKAISFEERSDRVRRAIDRLDSGRDYYGSYVEFVYEGYAIVREYESGTYYRVTYSESDGAVTVQPRSEWQRVEKEWAAKSTRGLTIKSLTDDHAMIAGYGVVFGGLDVTGDTFVADTEFDVKRAVGRPVLYDHTLQAEVQHEIGQIKAIEADDTGLWFEAQLDRRQKYVEHVIKLIEQGALGYSTGSVPHLVRRDAGTIKSWPIIEISLTPTPAEPRTGVSRIKSTPDTPASQDAPQTAGDAVADVAAAVVNTAPPSTSQGTSPTMEHEVKNETVDVSAQLAELKAAIAALSAEPATKSAGVHVPNVIVQKDEPQDALKAFNHYLLTGDVAPYKAALKASPLVEGTPASGGFLVPTQYSNELIVALQRQSYLRQAGARIMQVSGTTSFRMPKLTNSGAAVLTGEGVAYNEAGPDVGEIEFKPYKYTRMTRVTEELEADSRIEVFSQIIQPDIAYAFVQAENPAFTSGTGVSQPQGIVTGATNTQLAAGSVSAVTGDQLIAHQFRLAAPYQLNAKWMMNFDTLGKIRALKDSQNRYLWAPGLDGNVSGSLLGKPIVINDALPNMGASAKFLLYGDFTYFVIADWAGMGVQRLAERYAELGQVGFRTFRRFDSRVVLAEAIQSLQNSAT